MSCTTHKTEVPNSAPTTSATRKKKHATLAEGFQALG